MLLISEWYNPTKQAIVNIKAPKGYQYKIDTIYVIFENTQASTFYIVPRPLDVQSAYPSVMEMLFISTIVANKDVTITNLNHKTKYLGWSCQSATSEFNAWIMIYGELIPISKTESIWEYITKIIR